MSLPVAREVSSEDRPEFRSLFLSSVGACREVSPLRRKTCHVTTSFSCLGVRTHVCVSEGVSVGGQSVGVGGPTEEVERNTDSPLTSRRDSESKKVVVVIDVFIRKFIMSKMSYRH